MKLKKRIEKIDEQVIHLRNVMVEKRESREKDKASMLEYEKARKEWFDAVSEREKLKTKLRFSEFAQKYPNDCRHKPKAIPTMYGGNVYPSKRSARKAMER